DQGIADPRRLAIMGGSYGGYAVLMGLAQTPELFAAGIEEFGPADLLTMMGSMPAYWDRAFWARRLGDPTADAEQLRARSPRLLVAQGANDPRVPRAQSDEIVATLRRAGKPVEYVLYRGEGHGFIRPQNRLHFNALAEQFLARYLDGRYEPAGPIDGHTAVRPA